MSIQRPVYMGFLCVGLIALLCLFAWQQYQIYLLPGDEVEIPVILDSTRVEIPSRPGVQGIVISGPNIEPLYFSIDLTKGGVRSLNWRQLQTIDPHADVKVYCWIDDQGQLSFFQEGIFMGGHTGAGMMIQRAIRTWVYTPYKTGLIRFWFNLPSKGKKLIIDTSGLEKKRDIPNHVPIFDGQIHFVEGIRPEELLLGGHF